MKKLSEVALPLDAVNAAAASVARVNPCEAKTVRS